MNSLQLEESWNWPKISRLYMINKGEKIKILDERKVKTPKTLIGFIYKRGKYLSKLRG